MLRFLFIMLAGLGFAVNLATAQDLNAGLGEDLDGLRQAARALNPQAAAKALEAAAQLQAVGAAGALPDPEFEISFEDIDRNPNRGPQPTQLGSIYYNIDQTVPLWGKRSLEQRIATARATLAASEKDQTDLVLDAEVKIAFAAYCFAAETNRLNMALHDTLGHIAEIATERYALAAATQRDAAIASAELSHLEREQISVTRDLRIAQSRLNALLARPAGSPLSEPREWREIPALNQIHLDDLIARSLASAPRLRGQTAAIDAARGEADLAARAWYPDLRLGVSVVDENRDLRGYEARIGFDIPLQWDAKTAAETSARTRQAAAERNLQAERVDLQRAIEEAYWSLDAASAQLTLINDTLLPQAQLALEGTLAAYEVAQADIDQVLESQRQVQNLMVARLQLRFEQQTQLAQLETLIGGDL